MLFKLLMTDIRLLAGIAFALVINIVAMCPGFFDIKIVETWPITSATSPQILKMDDKEIAVIFTIIVQGQERKMVRLLPDPSVPEHQRVWRGYFFGSRGRELRKPFMLKYHQGYLPHLEIGDDLHLIRLDTVQRLPEPGSFLRVLKATRNLKIPYVVRPATMEEFWSVFEDALERHLALETRPSALRLAAEHNIAESPQMLVEDALERNLARETRYWDLRLAAEHDRAESPQVWNSATDIEEFDRDPEFEPSAQGFARTFDDPR